MTQKVRELIDANTGLMRCRVCGAEGHANIRPQSGGRYWRGAWQCEHGCKLEEASADAKE